MSKKIIVLLLVPIIMAVGVINISRADANTTSDLQAQIAVLLEQVQALQEQIQALQGQQKQLRTDLRELTLQLREGVRGGEVTALQETLATDTEIYPEGLVTGYFGPLTRRAVVRFQQKYGIDPVGEVGPQTRRAFNAFYRGGNVGKSQKTPIRLLKKFEAEEGAEITDDDDADNDDDAGTGAGTTKVTICHKGKNTLVVAAPAINAHLAHGDTLGACGSSGDDDVDDDSDDDDVDTTAPIITLLGDSPVNLLVGGPYTDAGATALDDVDGDLTSSIVTVNPVDTEAADTYTITYNVSDTAGNPATQVTRTVNVSEAPDETAPLISNISVTATTTSATVSWDTDEEADEDTVWYSTNSPLTISSTTAKAVSLDEAYTFSHSVALSPLASTTTYYFVVVSSDMSGNTATSTENSFVTQ